MPTFPNVLAGQRITAGLLNSMLPLTVVKAADESVTSSTALQDDNELVLPLATAGATYDFSCYLDYEGAAIGTGDLKITWTLPAGATLRYQMPSLGAGGATNEQNTYVAGSVPALGTKGAGNLCGATLTGTLVVAATTGNLRLQWAQNTSSVTATIVHAQSSLTLLRTA